MLPLILLFGLAWLFAKITEIEPRRKELPGPKPPLRLLTSAATNVVALDVTDDSTHPKSLCQISIIPGQEVFTPPIPQGMLMLLFQGSIAIKQDLSNAKWQGIDAWFMTDADYNFLQRHHCLVINGAEVYDKPVETDRAIHRYAFEFNSEGGRIGVLLKWPFNYPDTHATTGVINLSITWRGPLAESPHGAARKREEERTRRALELAALAHLESNFLDPEYQRDYAASHVPRILGQDSREWLNEYKEVIADPDLYALIEAEHPHVIEFLEARLQVVRLAQRLAVKPTPEPKEPESKRRLTREEWEARIERYRQRQLDRMRVSADDRIAKMLEKVESARRLRERAEDLGLDEDQIERLEQELMGDLQEDEEEHTNSFKQL
jgi:hypothetical protein